MTEQPDELSKALSHLGDVLCMLAELHPDDQCRAYVEALAYYNAQCPSEQIVPSEGYSSRIVTTGPLDRLLERESGNGWQDYPANKPIQFAECIPLSHPLLFLTESDEGSHIRLGHYDHEDVAFYESEAGKHQPWTHTVTKYLPIPYPKVKRNVIEVEGGK